MTTMTTMTNEKAQSILDAIDAGIAAGGDQSDWDAPQFAAARTATAGIQWDFDGWDATAQPIRTEMVMRTGQPILGGVAIDWTPVFVNPGFRAELHGETIGWYATADEAEAALESAIEAEGMEA